MELRDVIKMGLRDIRYDVGPIITLIDGPSFNFNWEERPKLLLGQIQDADRIVISRTDLIDAKEIGNIRETLNIADHNLLLLSRQNGPAINDLVQHIVSIGQEKQPSA